MNCTRMCQRVQLASHAMRKLFIVIQAEALACIHGPICAYCSQASGVSVKHGVEAPRHATLLAQKKRHAHAS